MTSLLTRLESWRQARLLQQALQGAHRLRARIAGITLVELMITIFIVAVLAQLSMSMYNTYRQQSDIAKASSDIAAIAVDVALYANDHKTFPDSLAQIGRDTMLDPWGNPYQYLNHDSLQGNGQVRKDKNIVPINSDFDLYSMGPDGQSAAPLTASQSRDDIVRANNGRFVGVAAVYDP
ncbi:MAG TPA: prepilin-type N-terminal cleavage/methylation domain-containing protein [Casimicrobiaceae bacterium]|nr:prepilin-type N-terminal cleavage/methylation domain-containing protein [Casimicrobiaceae bacterium]